MLTFTLIYFGLLLVTGFFGGLARLLEIHRKRGGVVSSIVALCITLPVYIIAALGWLKLWGIVQCD